MRNTKKLLKRRENEDCTGNIKSSYFANFAVAALSTPTVYTFLKRADGGFAFNDIRKVLP